MNNLLDIAGHFLYIALRIILLPLFVALDIFLGTWLAAKFLKKWSRAVYIKATKKQAFRQPAFKKGLVIFRTH
jgi:hypothetical protein